VNFAARDLVVSLAFLATIYCPLSLLAILVWNVLKLTSRGTAANTASLLFGLRILPFAISVVVTVFFTLPSFWLMERHSLDEDAGTFILALCALCICGAGVFRALKIQRRTKLAVQQWLAKRTKVECSVRTPSLSAAQGAPPVILVGISKPRVMISDAAATLLSDSELHAAIRHEISHARSGDNLKKVLVSLTPFPGMGGLEKAWQEAAELAADSRAVTSLPEALDLASALIKLSRSSQQFSNSLLATELVGDPSSIKSRVGRLLKWSVTGQPSGRGLSWALPVLLTFIIGLVTNYGAALVLTHRLTELLVP